MDDTEDTAGKKHVKKKRTVVALVLLAILLMGNFLLVGYTVTNKGEYNFVRSDPVYAYKPTEQN